MPYSDDYRRFETLSMQGAREAAEHRLLEIVRAETRREFQLIGQLFPGDEEKGQ